jgi:CBS domain containing-hemolysin-like protein
MNAPVLLGLLMLVLGASALASGAETGLYCLSRSRVEAEAAGGSRRMRAVRALLHDDTGLLMTLLLLNNATHQIMAYLAPQLLGQLQLPVQFAELVSTLIFAPLIFFWAELFPKDLFRRRPHHLVPTIALFLAGLKRALAPLLWPLRLLVKLLSNALGLEAGELGRVQGREAVLELLRERARPTQQRTEHLARNALELRSLRIERVMVPWRRVEILDLSLEVGPQRARLQSSPYSRLPVVDGRGTLKGYIHQLEALAAPTSRTLVELVRPLPFLEAGTPLDRALERLRLSGQRLAVVGTPQRPLGLVTLKDVLEEITGEIHRW